MMGRCIALKFSLSAKVLYIYPFSTKNQDIQEEKNWHSFPLQVSSPTSPHSV